MLGSERLYRVQLDVDAREQARPLLPATRAPALSCCGPACGHPRSTASPNHLLHLEGEGQGSSEGEGLSGLEVEDELELPGLLHRQVARVGPLADVVAGDGGVPELVGPLRAGRHEAPHCRKLRKAVPRHSPVLGR
jgi:hypothetical protein